MAEEGPSVIAPEPVSEEQQPTEDVAEDLPKGGVPTTSKGVNGTLGGENGDIASRPAHLDIGDGDQEDLTVQGGANIDKPPWG